MLKQSEMREISDKALQLEGIKRFEKYIGKINFLHYPKRDDTRVDNNEEEVQNG